MVGYSNLACQNHKVAKLNAARQTHFRREYAMPANEGVVPNMNEIINLGAFTDHRIGQSAPIDAGIRPNLDVVLNDDTTKLRDFEVPARSADIAKTVLPNPSSAVNMDAIPNEGVAD